MTSLPGLSTALEGALQGHTLTLTPGQGGGTALDGFLATLPARSLTLQKAQIRLSNQQRPATLVVSGAMTGTWALPGLTATALSPQAATVSFRQDGPRAAVTADLAVAATLTVGTRTLRLSGSLDDGAILRFAWSERGGALSLADAAGLATDGRAVAYLPADAPPFSRLLLSSFALSFGFGPAALTTMQFSLAAEPGATWDIVPGQHILKRVGVSLVASYRPAPGGGSVRSAFGGNVHATLKLGQDFDVTVGLAPGHLWEIDVAPAAGLPALESLAAIVGAQAEVRTGLRSLGLGDITVQAVRLGVDRAAGTLAFIAVQGALSLLGKVVNVYVRLPDFEFGGSLSTATPLSLKDLLENLLGDAGTLADVAITELSLAAAPQAGSYSLTVAVADNQITVGQYGLADLTLNLDQQRNGITGGIIAAIQVAGSPVIVSGSYGPGWSVTGQIDRVSLSDILADVLAEVGLPAPMLSLELQGLTTTWNLSSGSFSFQGEVDLDIELGPRTLTSTLEFGVDSTVDAQGNRITSGQLTGSLSLGGMVFGLRYDFKPGQQILLGTWNDQDGARFAALAAAFGIDVPASDVTLPDLSLTSMSFEVDYRGTGPQAFRLTGATSIGTAFFVVDRPQPDQPWGFAFGAAIAGATHLSQVLSPIGVSAAALDFIVLDSAFFLVSSAAFPALQVPGFTALGGQALPVRAGASAGVLVDLGATSGRPDVAALRTLLSGRPPVLLGEVTLSTSLAALAVTVPLGGDLKIAGAGSSSLTLADVSLVLKPAPVALTLRGSIEFPVGDVTLLATGMLTVGETGLTAVFDIQGENGDVLPIPMGFKGVHLTDIGVELELTLEPPSVAAGLLGRFVIGPQPPRPGGPVPARALTAMPPPDDFVMIIGLEGEIPNPLLLSMYLQSVMFGTLIEALTDQASPALPPVLSGIRATDLMIYWCDAAAGIQQPDGTWAYAGFGVNATLDFYGFRAHASLQIDSAQGITGDACIDPVHFHDVIDLTGDGPGTPATYQGQATVKPGGAQIHVSTIASPYFDINWKLALFTTVSESVNAQVTNSGFTFDVVAAAPGFSSTLSCSLRSADYFAMTFSVLLNLDVDLGSISGIDLGRVHLADTGLTASLVATVAASFGITINGNFEFDGTSYVLPQISASVAFSSLADIPQEIFRQLENEGQAIFPDICTTAGKYLDLVDRGMVTGGAEIGSVLRTAYGQTADQAAQILKAAGYSASDVGSALKNAYGISASQAAQILKDAGYGTTEVGNALTSVWGATANDVAGDLKSAGYALSDVGTYIRDTFNYGPDQLSSVLQAAGYATDQINTFFNTLGGAFEEAVKKLDPTTW